MSIIDPASPFPVVSRHGDGSSMALKPGAVNMTSENQGPDPYDAVLADLKAKRDQIDQTIALLTSLRAGGPAPAAAAASNEGGIVETAGMFLGMSIADATKKLLAMRKRTMGNVEISRELQAGGLALTAKDPINVVGSVLTRRFNEVGDVVKVGRGIWGLKEWYPGRNFKPAAKATAIMEEAIAEAVAEAANSTDPSPAPDVYGVVKPNPLEGLLE